MKHAAAKLSIGSNLAQIAWVVKDIETALRFFRGAMGVKDFSKVATIRAKDYDGTYYGQPSDGESLVSMAYSGGTFIELIQPTSGHSVFHDWLNKNPGGGVQHVAYSLPIADFDKVISQLTDEGYPIISTFDTPIAKIFFFDTYKDLGVATEIMGITKEGEVVVAKMKSGAY